MWTRACGRCQFEGCNILLLGDALSGRRSLNKAYIAHIVAAEAGGPRGDPVLSPQLCDDPDNLMLLCDAHHRLVDRDDPGAFPVERLRRMKRWHETRIAAVTEIADDRATHVLFYGARVGQHDCPARFDLAQRALLPELWSTPDHAIFLEMSGVAAEDHEPAYWELHSQNLQRLFETRVRERLARGDIRQLTVFPFAPQPLLFELGRLLGDVAIVHVRQLQREPQGWEWRAADPPLDWQVREPAGGAGPVALNISLSGQITDDRIHAVLGADAAVWTLTVPQPHNNLIRGESDLSGYRTAVRRLLDRIKARHGPDTTLHVFPAMPVSTAVEFGRCWMPKADLPLVVYDQCRRAGGFQPRVAIESAAPRTVPNTLEPAHG